MEPITEETAQTLCEAAALARQNSYSPYSDFAVGAAVLDEQGQIHAGCNVENSSFPLGVCAEANAISTMIAAGARSCRAIAVSSPDGSALPCGGCRQIIMEFAGPDTSVFVCDETGRRTMSRLAKELLPGAFRLGDARPE